MKTVLGYRDATQENVGVVLAIYLCKSLSMFTNTGLGDGDPSERHFFEVLCMGRSILLTK